MIHVLLIAAAYYSKYNERFGLMFCKTQINQFYAKYEYPIKIQGVHKLSLQFQKFARVLLFKIFSIGLFYRKRKCFKFT